MSNNILFAKRKRIVIIILIILAIAGCYSLLFFQQYISEQNIRNNIFQDYRNNQIGTVKALSEHMSSDLRLISSILQGLSDSSYLQHEELYGDRVESLIGERFNQINTITKIDGLFIADKNNIITYNKVAEGKRSFVNIDISLREYVNETRSTLKPVFSNGFKGIDGTYNIALTYPIINRDTGEYLGMIGVEIPSVEFFSRYGNVYNIDAQFLVTYDRNSNYISTPRSNFLGKNLFGDEVQNFFNHNIIQNNYYRNIFEGHLQGGSSLYNFGTGERLNTGYPIIVDKVARYFVFIITPTSTVYTDINKTLTVERTKFFSLLSGVSVAILILILFLVKLNRILNQQVNKRTKDLEESNRQLQSANKQLGIHDKLQKEFINTAAHELRTPTQAIMGYAELDSDLFDNILKHQEVIDNEKLKGELTQTHEFFKAISRNASRLNDLISNLLDLARIESDKINNLQLQMQKVNVVKEINEALNLQLEQKINTKNIQINFINQDKEKEYWIDADKSRLNQVLVNLIDNAIKFSEFGSTIDIEIKEHNYDHLKESPGVHNFKNNLDNQIFISISDKGKGISSQILPKIFEKFATDSDIGTGLGLYISKNIVEAHGGKIWAFNNKDGAGATFVFSLPRADNSES